MTTWVDAGGRLVDRDAVLAELHPPLSKVADESPSNPAQRVRHEAWAAWVSTPAREVAAASIWQEEDANRFIADREAAVAADAWERWKAGEDPLREELAAYAKKRARRTNPGPHSLEAA